MKLMGGSLCLLLSRSMLSVYPQLRMADHWMSVLCILLTPVKQWEVKHFIITERDNHLNTNTRPKKMKVLESTKERIQKMSITMGKT